MSPTNTNTKVMNRFDVTSRLVAKLKNEEAVIGGIGNTNFDLWAAGHRPQADLGRDHELLSRPSFQRAGQQ